MTATTFERDQEFLDYVPKSGTYPMRADTLAKKGWIACLDSSGNCTYGGGTGALNAVGVLKSTFDNRTTSPEGGAAGAVMAEVDFGIQGLNYSGTAPKPGQVVFVVDNQTVSTDSDSGSRGIAGMCVQTDTTEATTYIWMGPSVVGMITIGADVAADVTTLQGEMDDVEATLVLPKRIPIPVSSWAIAGVTGAAFADGATNGISVVDSECHGIRINPSGDVALPAITNSVVLPADIDLEEDLTLHVLACRIGASDVTVELVGNAFFQVAGAAYDADADAISTNSAALDSATKVLKELVLTVAAADLPASADASVTFSFAPTAALDADDLVIAATWLEYTPVIASA